MAKLRPITDLCNTVAPNQHRRPEQRRAGEFAYGGGTSTPSPCGDRQDRERRDSEPQRGQYQRVERVAADFEGEEVRAVVEPCPADADNDKRRGRCQVNEREPAVG